MNNLGIIMQKILLRGEGTKQAAELTGEEIVE